LDHRLTPLISLDLVIRNKFCYTLTLCFLRLYPSPVPDFLSPFLSFLNFPQSSTQAQNLQPTIVTLRMLCEIAGEVHDPLLKSARKWTAERNNRDGQVRDSLRVRGEVKIILDGLVSLVEQGIKSEGQPMMQEVLEWSMNTLATWARESH
jgi:exportin-T